MRFYGLVGFVVPVEIRLDVIKEIPEERPYSGEVLRKSNRSVETTSTINDNIINNSQISIVADPYLNQHFPSIRYVKWNGAYWKVMSIDQTNYPRLILNLGEVYNGPKVEPEYDTP